MPRACMVKAALPRLVVHADWGWNPSKRWLAHATLQRSGRYLAHAPAVSSPPDGLLESLTRLCLQVGGAGSLLVGFDFPIGVPAAYAERAGITSFVKLLPLLGSGHWASFYRVAERESEIGLYRPFYPLRPGGTSLAHLVNGLGLGSAGELLRECDRPSSTRGAASPLFWTLGAKQVGKAAIVGWRDVLGPALSSLKGVAVWPFSGALFGLLASNEIVVVETYPAECYRHLGVRFPSARAGLRSGKRVQTDRAANSAPLMDFASRSSVDLSPSLRRAIEDGFGTSADGEDQFDAVVGLFAMLNVVLGHREPGDPSTKKTRHVEGWILGQASQ